MLLSEIKISSHRLKLAFTNEPICPRKEPISQKDWSALKCWLPMVCDISFYPSSRWIQVNSRTKVESAKLWRLINEWWTLEMRLLKWQIPIIKRSKWQAWRWMSFIWPALHRLKVHKRCINVCKNDIRKSCDYLVKH